MRGFSDLSGCGVAGPPDRGARPLIRRLRRHLLPQGEKGRSLAAALGLTLFLAACATAPPHVTPGPTPGPTPAPAPVEQVQPESFADLPGWDAEDHAAAFAAYRAVCGAAHDPAAATVCRRARSTDNLAEPQARAFFEDNFRPERIVGEGVLTAYFAPEYPARKVPDADFSAPVRPRPADLVLGGPAGKDPMRRLADGSLGPYPDRAWIETSGPPDALAWMRPEDLFFLQIQGSGLLTYEDGSRIKALFSATNGRPFVGVANLMRDKGLLAADKISGESIRAWLADHRGDEAQSVMRLNPRYAFFRLAPDDGQPPIGAAGLPLPAGRAVAMDASRHSMGELFYLDATAPILTGAFPTYRRLVTALDVGGAIKGDIRADLYLGQGPAAGTEAGRVRHTLRLHRLVPRP
ncbi:MltA domain-containing protein [Phenylobacterium aquaticum]|uniref:MltA domain-containing protein n=1 Tax=Phenylobacterium aquaticum TaxID=1763816 RepID=UPI0026F0BC23|nr:MltA domain-containing protein [Phenylobacterium aquaticum]